MSALEAAIQRLREAGPDPSVVEALADRTVNERNNPHTFQTLFVSSLIPGDISICQLCGMQAPRIYKGPGVHPATQHVTWHNQLHQAGIEAA